MAFFFELYRNLLADTWRILLESFYMFLPADTFFILLMKTQRSQAITCNCAEHPKNCALTSRHGARVLIFETFARKEMKKYSQILLNKPTFMGFVCWFVRFLEFPTNQKTNKLEV